MGSAWFRRGKLVWWGYGGRGRARGTGGERPFMSEGMGVEDGKRTRIRRGEDMGGGGE